MAKREAIIVENIITSTPEDIIHEFKIKFMNVFGVIPKVTYDLSKKMAPLNLHELVSIVNGYFKELYPKIYLEPGIENRCRKKEFVNFRGCYYTLALEMLYTQESTAVQIGFDHASVVHHKKRIKIDHEDTIVNQLLEELRNRIENYSKKQPEE